MLRSFKAFALSGLCWAALLSTGSQIGVAQGKQDQKKGEPVINAETVAETVVLVYGGRPVLDQVRRTAVERGRVSRAAADGPDLEISYERFFKRGETIDKDKIRLDQKRTNLEYSIIYNDGRVWGIIKGTSFTPRQEELADFDSNRYHTIENLLRYKENGAKLSFVGKDRQKNIDLWMLDLTDRENRRTRYFISSQTGRILWLEYEETPQGANAPVKFKKTFHDYRIVQSTRLPYRVVLYANDKKLQETQINTVTYGVKMEDSVFKNEETGSTGGF